MNGVARGEAFHLERMDGRPVARDRGGTAAGGCGRFLLSSLARGPRAHGRRKGRDEPPNAGGAPDGLGPRGRSHAAWRADPARQRSAIVKLASILVEAPERRTIENRPLEADAERDEFRGEVE